MAALTFMGSRIELWEPELREDMAAFFSRVAYKRTIEWKEEIVFLSPAPAKPIVTRFPDGSRVTIRPTETRGRCSPTG